MAHATRVTKILMTENSTNPDARGVSDKRIPDNPALQVSPSAIIVQKRDIGQKHVEVNLTNNYATNKLMN